MKIITKEEFKELINYRYENAISIYIPSHRSGAEVNEKKDALVFKRLLQDAKAELKKRGLGDEDTEALLRTGYDLQNNEVFWNNQTEGLAVFIGKDFMKTIQLPFTVTEKLYINSSYLVAPLLPTLIKNEDFYLLVLSKHDARLYQGNEFGLYRVNVAGLAQLAADAHPAQANGTAPLIESPLTDKVNTGIDFQEVDKIIFAEVLHDKSIPLVLAGVEYLIPMYKSISKYKMICDEFITGNREKESMRTLFEKTKSILTPYFEQRTNDALKNYYAQIATSATSSMPEKVIPATHYAQVSDLFISRDTHLWGRFNEADHQLDIHQTKENGDHCLLNEAAAKTFLNGGNVFMLDRDRMPKESIIAASFRF